MRHLAINLRRFTGRYAFWLCLFLTLCGAALRFHNLEQRSFWYDEAVEVIVARAPLDDLWPTALERRLPDPPLSTLLLHAAHRLGTSEFILRFPYALLGTMAVYAGYYLFRLWLSPAGALLPQALLAFAPAQVFYAQEVGQYALMVLTSILIIWSFERAVRRITPRRLALFTLCAVLGVLVHYGLYWLLGGLALTLLWRQRSGEWRRWWPAGLALGVLTFLIAAFIAWPQYQVLQAAYPPSPIFTSAELRALSASLVRTAHLFADFNGRWAAPAISATWFYIASLLFGLVVAWRKTKTRPVAAMFLLPLLLAYLASKLGLYLWGMRYLLFLSPLFYLLLGIGLLKAANILPVGWLVPLAAVGFLLFNQMFFGWPNAEQGEHLRPVVAELQAHVTSDSSIYVHYGARPAFEVYYTGNWENVRLGEWFRNLPLAEQMGDILPSFAPQTETWFVTAHYDPVEIEAIREQLNQRCRPVRTIQETNALAIQYACSTD